MREVEKGGDVISGGGEPWGGVEDQGRSDVCGSLQDSSQKGGRHENSHVEGIGAVVLAVLRECHVEK